MLPYCCLVNSLIGNLDRFMFYVDVVKASSGKTRPRPGPTVSRPRQVLARPRPRPQMTSCFALNRNYLYVKLIYKATTRKAKSRFIKEIIL